MLDFSNGGGRGKIEHLEKIGDIFRLEVRIICSIKADDEKNCEDDGDKVKEGPGVDGSLDVKGGVIFVESLHSLHKQHFNFLLHVLHIGPSLLVPRGEKYASLIV